MAWYNRMGTSRKIDYPIQDYVDKNDDTIYGDPKYTWDEYIQS